MSRLGTVQLDSLSLSDAGIALNITVWWCLISGWPDRLRYFKCSRCTYTLNRSGATNVPDKWHIWRAGTLSCVFPMGPLAWGRTRIFRGQHSTLRLWQLLLFRRLIWCLICALELVLGSRSLRGFHEPHLQLLWRTVNIRLIRLSPYYAETPPLVSVLVEPSVNLKTLPR